MAIGRSFGSAIDDHRAIDDHQACDTLGPRFPLVLAIGDHLGATEHTRRVARERRAVVGSEVEWKTEAARSQGAATARAAGVGARASRRGVQRQPARGRALWQRDARGREKVAEEGLEPPSEFAATDCGICDCEGCQQCRAANALHYECFKSRFLASLDADLRCLFARWDRLDDSARQAIAAYGGRRNESDL
jgi:hypothetical protein